MEFIHYETRNIIQILVNLLCSQSVPQIRGHKLHVFRKFAAIILLKMVVRIASLRNPHPVQIRDP